MTRTIDLNADMGEGYGRWSAGDDAAMLAHVSSANIACGMHAGDPDVMARTMAAAVAAGVGIGAHPGFADLQGFGRRRLALSSPSLRNLLRYQLGAAAAMARGAGGRLRHVKLHGALSNMACEDPLLARTCLEEIRDFDPDLLVLVLPQTALERVARDLGLPFVGEIFADRAYAEDATLLDRSQPGAMIHDPDEAAARVCEMVAAGAIITHRGTHIPCTIGSVCVHGDTPEGVSIARRLRAALEDAGHAVRPM